MSDGPPRLEDLVDALGPEERARLERVHDQLVEAGPPPELPPALAAPPVEPSGTVVPLVLRYRFAAVAAAAVAAVALFGTGYLLGSGGTELAERTIAMTGPGGATGSLDVFAKDGAGNWPMELTVAGLPELPSGSTYELWLTRGGELAESCGSFVVGGEETTVRLNAGYRLGEFSGWVVVEAGSEEFALRTESV